MKQLPERSNLDHLKKQAKDLLRAYRANDPAALERFAAALPAAAGKSTAALAALALRLHDAQSCIAREYGFASWHDLATYVAATAVRSESRAERVLRWLRHVYAADASGGTARATPGMAARLLAEDPSLATGDPYLACAIGDHATLERIATEDRAWVNRAGGPLAMPPLVAVTHSSLVRLAAFREALHRSARVLLAAGADPNQSIGIRSSPASLESPSSEGRLSVLYGAAGLNHDPVLTELLLLAGADPNDGESLYHSLENRDCVRLLLDAGAIVAGSNVIYRAFDLDDLPMLELLLAHGADPNEPARNEPLNEWGSPLLWAIYRRRSRAHVEALLEGGADPFARTRNGESAYKAALRFGLTGVANLLRDAGVAEPVSDEELFCAACASVDRAAALRIRAARPDLPASLPTERLRLLPDLVQEGCDAAVELMVELGWPIAVRGGDWDASALNLAVFRGDSRLTQFLLEHGAKWTEVHGYGDNVSGTLSWASVNEPRDGGDWVGCAEALLAHGMPPATPDRTMAGCVVIAGHRKRFSDDVTEVLLAATPTR